jgi:hypothetical protein
MIGKHNDILDSKFDKKELERGAEEEKEHTDKKEEQKAIAKDHIVKSGKKDKQGNIREEKPTYYDKLADAEEVRKCILEHFESRPAFKLFYEQI